MWLELHSEVLLIICKLCQLCHRCRLVGGWKTSSWQIGLEVVSIVPVTQPRDDKHQFPHCIHQMNHYPIQAQCGQGAQDLGKLILGEQGHFQQHGFHILLSWCGFCGLFQRCLAELLGVTACGLGICACCSGGADHKR